MHFYNCPNEYGIMPILYENNPPSSNRDYWTILHK
jgi:hypothetical protein